MNDEMRHFLSALVAVGGKGFVYTSLHDVVVNGPQARARQKAKRDGLVLMTGDRLWEITSSGRRALEEADK